MKIFLDTAVLDEIEQVGSWGILDGVTTNPTLAAKAGRDFEENIRKIKVKGNHGFETQVLAASLRHTLHVVDSALAGADIATMPFSVLKKALGHSLTREGVQSFLDDWATIPEKMRPF